MPFVPVSNVAQVQMVYTWDGQTVENVYHFSLAAAPIIGIMQDLAIDMKEWWITYLRGSAPGYFQLAKIIVTDLSTQTSPAIEYAVDMPIAGSYNGISLPNNVACAVKWTTGLRGRSYRGRTFHCPIPTTWVTGNTLSSGGISTMRDSYTALIDVDAGGISATLGVVSRFHNNAARAQGVFTAITGVSINATVDSQRRRLPERGR